MINLFFLFILIPTILFIYWLYAKPTSLFTGLFFLYFIGVLIFEVLAILEKINQQLAIMVAIPLILLLIFIGIFGIFSMIIALFWNERILLKHERLSFGNILPLIVAIILIIFEGTSFYFNTQVENQVLLLVFSFVNSSFFYFIGIFILFSLTALLYNWFPILSKVDYIIILGAGLNSEKVTPLLAARIDAGVKLYQKQVTKKDHHPTIILSGGQGSDEVISEAHAMKNYIDEKGITIQKIYLEEKSTNTKENLLFSERVASQRDNLSGLATKQVVIASSNYHLLRAGKLAKYQGIRARGVGAKTRLYYLPTGFIREYIGYLMMTKKRHIMVVSVLFIISFISITGVLLF